jgi:zinc protease
VDFGVPMQLHGFAAPAADNPDVVALEILQQIVSQGETSRLHRSLVRRESVAVMAGGANLLFSRAGMSLLFAAFTPDVSASRVNAAMEAEVRLARCEGVSEAEMEKVRNTTLTSHTFDMYSAEDLAHHLGFAETVIGDYRQWLRRLELLRTVTAEQVTEAARTYWGDSARWSLSLVPNRARPMLYLAGLARRVLSAGRRGARR